jgi:hypothetical protein
MLAESFGKAHIRYMETHTRKRVMTSFTGTPAVNTYQAIALKSAIKIYAKTGMKVNRAYTPTAMLATAGKITGAVYKRGQYDAAVAGLQTWIDANGTTGA